MIGAELLWRGGGQEGPGGEEEGKGRGGGGGGEERRWRRGGGGGGRRVSITAAVSKNKNKRKDDNKNKNESDKKINALTRGLPDTHSHDTTSWIHSMVQGGEETERRTWVGKDGDGIGEGRNGGRRGSGTNEGRNVQNQYLKNSPEQQYQPRPDQLGACQ